MNGRLALALLLVTAAGGLAGAVLRADRVPIDADGDWRAVSVGLQRARPRGALSAGRRAQLHLDAPGSQEGALEALVSAATDGVRLAVSRDGQRLFETALEQRPERIVVPFASGARAVEVALEAQGGGEALRPVLVHEIVVKRPLRAAGLVLAVAPAVAGVLTLLACWSRTRPLRAVLWAMAAVLGVAAGLAVVADPVALLRYRPLLRGRIQASFVAGLAALGLTGSATALPALAAVTGTALAVGLPGLRNGLVYDDFLWARPWSLGQVASTFHGSEDPLGVSNEYYRPLASTSHALDHLVWGFRPEAYHLTNVLLLALNGALLLRLLRRLGIGPRPALLGALAFAAHPLALSAVGWISQRTDALVVAFCLLTLGALVGPLGARPLRVLAPMALALGSKEPAVVLPVLGALLAWAALPGEALRQRLPTLRAMALLALAHVAFWVALFPHKLVGRVGDGGWGGMTPAASEAAWRFVPGLLAPLFFPTGYEHWWRTRLADWPAAQLLLAAAIGPLVLALAAWCPSCRGRSERLACAGVLWPVIVALPMLGLKGIDVYRLGLLPAVGFALLAAVLATHAEHVWRQAPAALAALLLLLLVPLARQTLQAWGPGGFYYDMTQRFNRESPEWLARLTPESRGRFFEQLQAKDHLDRLEAWVEESAPR